MRSFFKRPSWASRDTEDSASDFYRRSEQTYGDIIAATKEARERSATNTASDHSVENSKTTKCRRISDQVCVKDDTSSDIKIQDPGVIDDQTSPLLNPENGPRDVPRGLRGHNSQRFPFRTELLVTSNDAAHDREPSPHGQSAHWGHQTHGRSPTRSHEGYEKTSAVADDDPDSDDISLNGGGQKIEGGASHHTDAQEDMVVQILITSEIENTKPLIVHRKISQSLREVRLAWCKRQGFSEGMQASVFLIWKGRRLFDVTTCKSLGVNTGNNSARSPIHSPLDDGQTNRVHMEAVTEDLLSLKRRQQEQSHSAEYQNDTESSDVRPKQQDVLIKIILKCPGLVDYGIKVSQETPVSHVLATFKNAQRISADKEVYLLFDGERLDPGSRLVDYDIADLDLVDVIVK